MTTHPDIIIIGGGAIGLLSAIELKSAGAAVMVIDKSAAATESTWAGGGILSPLHPWRYPDCISDLAQYSQTHYAKFSDFLADKTGIDPELHMSGLMVETRNELSQAIEWAEKRRKPIVKIDQQQRKELEPELRSENDNTIWMPEVAQIRNPRFGLALRHYCDLNDIPVIEHTEIQSINVIDENHIKLVAEKQTFEAPQVVVASGAWSRSLLSDLSAPPNITPVKGEMVIFRCPENMLKHIHLDQDRYSIPRKDGRVLFGSTIEHAGFNKQTSPETKQQLIDVATKRFPILKDYPIEHHWAGLRPGSPDGIPLISHHPEHHNLWINTGHFRNGLVLALGSAKLLKQIMTNESRFMDSTAFKWQH